MTHLKNSSLMTHLMVYHLRVSNNKPTIWDHITEEEPTFFGRVQLLLVTMGGRIKSKLVALKDWATGHPEVAAPVLFLLIVVPTFTWVFFQAKKKAEEEKAALEAKRENVLATNSARAKKHWAEWRRTFLSDDAKVVCYHGDNHLHWDGEGRMDYTISCNVQERLEEFSVTCDERHCHKGLPLTDEEKRIDTKTFAKKEDLARRAKAHWAEWKDKFVENTPTVCYHGDNLVNYKEDQVQPYYKITCYLGPEKAVVCDQNHCTPAEVKKGKVEKAEVEEK